jgi:hypothetical protein
MRKPKLAAVLVFAGLVSAAGPSSTLAQEQADGATLVLTSPGHPPFSAPMGSVTVRGWTPGVWMLEMMTPLKPGVSARYCQLTSKSATVIFELQKQLLDKGRTFEAICSGTTRVDLEMQNDKSNFTLRTTR